MNYHKLYQLLASLTFRQRFLIDFIFGGLAVALIIGPALLIFGHFNQLQAQTSNLSPVQVVSLSPEEVANIQAQAEVGMRATATVSVLKALTPVALPPSAAVTLAPTLANSLQNPPMTNAKVAATIAAYPVLPHEQVRVPSLTYHHIRKLSGTPAQAALDRYSTDPQLFIQELDWLQANGYHTVTVSQVADYLLKGTPLPDKPINLRFDDGWQNQLFAAQEMRKRGLTATFFIISQANSGPYMSREQVRSLDAQGFEVAAHSRNHPQLTRLATSKAQTEISGSKQDLESLLGHPVRAFAYPYGDVNPQIEALAKAAGFDIALGVGHSYSWTQANRFREPAISMESLNSLTGFIYRVTAVK